MANNILPGEHDWMYNVPGANPRMGMGFPTPAPARGPGIMDRIGGLLGGAPAYGGMVDEEARKAAQRQGLMAMAAQLMSAGGYSPERVSFGQALGPALMAGQQAQNQGIEQAMQAMLLKTKLQQAKNKQEKDTRPSDVQSYEYAKANGYTGSFEDWKRVAAAQPQSPANIQEYEYFQKLSPEQQKQFLTLQRSPVLPQIVTVNGVPTLVDRTNGDQTPLSTQQAEIQAESTKQFESALAKARGTARGELEGGIQKKGQNAGVVQGMLTMADPLIDVATGSQTGAAADKVAGWFGVALDGAKATAQLRVLQASLMTNMPRMEGPQSDADVLLYRQAAGEIGDPTVPRGLKKSALRTIQALQNKYAEAAQELPQPGLPTPQAAPQPQRPPLSSFQK